MIRGVIRLGILYLFVWAVCVNWDGGADFYRNGIEGIRAFLPFPAAAGMVLAFLGMACFWHLLGCWFWIYTIKLDPKKGPVRHPLPVQPLRHYFRLRARRTTGAVVSSLAAFLFALQALGNLRFSSFSPGVFSWVYHITLLPDLGGRSAPWIAYGLVHLCAAVFGWALLVFAFKGIKRFGPPKDGNAFFMRYQARRNPAAKVFAIVVLLTHFPFAGITAATHAHPFHGLAVLCSLAGILLAALLGQAASLEIARRHDAWLASLGKKAQVKGRESEEYKIWESTLIFLTGEKPLPPDGSDGTGPSDSGETGEKCSANAKTGPEKKRNGKPGSLLEKIIRPVRVLAIPFLAAGILVSLGLVFQWSTLPGAGETRQLARSAHVHVKKYHDGGDSKVVLYGNRYDYSLNISLENISKDFRHAVIASEDHRFYDHGVPYILAKFSQAAVLCAVKKLNPLSGGACHGNSTLPQQLARNLFLSEKRSVGRKLSELLWALKMETGLSKEEILDFYMNRIYLGNGNYGVEMAARDYFQKNASDLGPGEAAYLAAAIKRPSWNWHQDRENAAKRARLIFRLMKKYGYAVSSEAFPEKFTPLPGAKDLHKPYLGHLWQWAEKEVEAVMRSLPNGNYKVLTTLNAEVEIYAEKALQKEISRLRNAGKQVSQGAVVVMRPDGKVLAMVGGAGPQGRFFNRAKRTQGLLPRPPASAFKPFVYLAALESGLEPDSRINAGPVSIPMPGKERPYQPGNHDGKTYGDVSLREGLVYSINTAAVNLLHDHVGFKGLLDTVERLGIQPDTLGKQWGLALGQDGIPLIEMTGAYAVFANGGNKVTPYTVTAITNESGKTIWRRQQEKAKRVFQRDSISSMNSMLHDVVRMGTGKQAARRLPNKSMLAGKTGTGDGFVDAWFIGYTSDLVIGVWIGNDKPVPMDGVYGGTGPARIFNHILRNLMDYTHITTGTDPLP